MGKGIIAGGSGGSSGSNVSISTVTIGANWTEDSTTGVKSQIVAIEGTTAERYVELIGEEFVEG